MKRSPLAPGKPLARRTGLRPRSVKRARLDREHTEAKRAFLADRPWCELRLAGCTARATVIDHRVPRSRRPDLIYDESVWRPSCWSCNTARGSRVLPGDEEMGAAPPG